MNTQQMRRVIRRELDELNHKIDAKIVRGRSYAAEARRHKDLLFRLYNLNKAPQRSWFGLVSTFLF